MKETVKLSTLAEETILVEDGIVITAGELTIAARRGEVKASNAYTWSVGMERSYKVSATRAIERLLDDDYDNGLPDSLIDDARTALKPILPEIQALINKALDNKNLTYWYGSGPRVEIDIISGNEEEEHIKWLGLLNAADVQYGLSHDGISYHSAADLEKVRQIAKEHAMEHMLEDDPQTVKTEKGR